MQVSEILVQTVLPIHTLFWPLQGNTRTMLHCGFDNDINGLHESHVQCYVLPQLLKITFTIGGVKPLPRRTSSTRDTDPNQDRQGLVLFNALQDLEYSGLTSEVVVFGDPNDEAAGGPFVFLSDPAVVPRTKFNDHPFDLSGWAADNLHLVVLCHPGGTIRCCGSR